MRAPNACSRGNSAKIAHFFRLSIDLIELKRVAQITNPDPMPSHPLLRPQTENQDLFWFGFRLVSECLRSPSPSFGYRVAPARKPWKCFCHVFGVSFSSLAPSRQLQRRPHKYEALGAVAPTPVRTLAQLLAAPAIFRWAGGPFGGSDRYCGLLGPPSALFCCPTGGWPNESVSTASVMTLWCSGDR